MVTGSDILTAAPYRLAVSLLPDREEELLADTLSLFCEISRTHVSVMRFDAAARKAVDQRDWLFPYCSDDTRWATLVRTIFSEERIIGLNGVVVTDVRNSLIPNDLLPASDEGRNALLHFELGDLSGHEVISAGIGAWDAEAVSLLPSEIVSLLAGAVVVPELAVWSGALLRNTDLGRHAYILMGQRRFSLAIIKDSSLLLHNVFEFDAAEDVLYFVLAALEQLEIPQRDVKVAVSGQVKKEGPLMELLGRYLPGAKLSDQQANISFAYSFKELPRHRSPLLSSLPLCV